MSLISDEILFPGSFDPVTLGHLDVVQRLVNRFSKVVVLVTNSEGKEYFFNMEERLQLTEKCLSRFESVEITHTDRLTVEFAKKRNITTIARSVRSFSDWDHESTLARANKTLNPEIDTLFFLADPQWGHVSSSLVKEIARYGGDLSGFVAKDVELALKSKF